MLFRRSVREIAAWPAWEVRLLEEYLAHQPAPEERLEMLGARFAAMYFNFNSDKGSAKFETADFLHFLHPFKKPEHAFEDGRYSELDLELFRALNR